MQTKTMQATEARTLKAALANKAELKALRRARWTRAAQSAIGSGKDGAPLSKTALKAHVSEQIKGELVALQKSDAELAKKGWNYDPTSKSCFVGSIGWYSSATDKFTPIIAGSARVEYNSAMSRVIEKMDTGLDADQAIREALELNEADLFRAQAIGDNGPKWIKTMRSDASSMLHDWFKANIVEAGLSAKEARAKLDDLKRALTGTKVTQRKARKAA